MNHRVTLSSCFTHRDCDVVYGGVFKLLCPEVYVINEDTATIEVILDAQEVTNERVDVSGRSSVDSLLVHDFSLPYQGSGCQLYTQMSVDRIPGMAKNRLMTASSGFPDTVATMSKIAAVA